MKKVRLGSNWDSHAVCMVTEPDRFNYTSFFQGVGNFRGDFPVGVVN